MKLTIEADWRRWNRPLDLQIFRHGRNEIAEDRLRIALRFVLRICQFLSISPGRILFTDTKRITRSLACTARRGIIMGYIYRRYRVYRAVRRGRSWIFHRDCITLTLRRYLSRLGAGQASHKYMHNNVTQFILRPTSAQNVPRPGADVILLTAVPFDT